MLPRKYKAMLLLASQCALFLYWAWSFSISSLFPSLMLTQDVLATITEQRRMELRSENYYLILFCFSVYGLIHNHNNNPGIYLRYFFLFSFFIIINSIQTNKYWFALLTRVFLRKCFTMGLITIWDMRFLKMR